MKILVVSHHLPPRHVAGTETYSRRLADALSARHEVRMFATNDDPGLVPGSVAVRSAGSVRIAEFAEPRQADVPDASWASPRAEAAFEAELAEFAPDVVHFQNARFLGFGVVGAAKRRGARTVFTLNDHWLVCARDGLLVDRGGEVCPGPAPERCASCLVGYRFGLTASEARAARFMAAVRRATGLDPAALARRAALGLRGRRAVSADEAAALAGVVSRRNAAARKLIDAVDLFVAPSRFVGRVHEAAGFPAERMRLLPYGVDGVPRPAAPASSGPLRVAYFGVVAPHKGADVLIDAVLSLAPGTATLDVYGRDDQRPEFVGPLKRRARGGPVRFHGVFAAADAPKKLADADLVVVPSRWPENLPQAALEARAHGVPVVASDLGGLPEIVRDGVDGALFPSGDVAATAALIREIAADRGRLELWRSRLPPPLRLAEHVATLESWYAERNPAGR